jgi:hypothetical protein
MEQKIDWKTFDDCYVRLRAGTEKTLVLTNWTPGKWFGKMGLGFDVLEETGKRVSKKLTVTNRSLIFAFKPILLKADDEGRDTVTVSILRSGEESDTRYSVRELPIDREDNKGLL